MPRDPAPFDDERHRRIVAHVERESCRAMNDHDYEPEYDSEGNYNRSARYSRDSSSFSRGSSNNWSRSLYGNDGGSHGFSSRDCDGLLDQGIKPWDDEQIVHSVPCVDGRQLPEYLVLLELLFVTDYKQLC